MIGISMRWGLRLRRSTLSEQEMHEVRGDYHSLTSLKGRHWHCDSHPWPPGGQTRFSLSCFPWIDWQPDMHLWLTPRHPHPHGMVKQSCLRVTWQVEVRNNRIWVGFVLCGRMFYVLLRRHSLQTFVFQMQECCWSIHDDDGLQQMKANGEGMWDVDQRSQTTPYQAGIRNNPVILFPWRLIQLWCC